MHDQRQRLCMQPFLIRHRADMYVLTELRINYQLITLLLSKATKLHEYKNVKH